MCVGASVHARVALLFGAREPKAGAGAQRALSIRR